MQILMSVCHPCVDSNMQGNGEQLLAWTWEPIEEVLLPNHVRTALLFFPVGKTLLSPNNTAALTLSLVTIAEAKGRIWAPKKRCCGRDCPGLK